MYFPYSTFWKIYNEYALLLFASNIEKEERMEEKQCLVCSNHISCSRVETGKHG